MTKPIVRIYTSNTEFIDREMNDVEFAQYEIDQAAEVARKAEAEAKAQAKVVAEGKLAALGLTADELKTILGGN